MDFALKTGRNTFANFGAPLARYIEEILVGVRIYGAAKVCIEFGVALPIGMAGRLGSLFQVVHTDLPRELLGRFVEGIQGFQIGRDRSSGHTKGIGY